MNGELKNFPEGSRAPTSTGMVFPAGAPIESLPGFALAVEGAGLDELWVVEDCFLSGGLTMAATALAVTERIRVGIGLLPGFMRNAALAAMEIATLARLHPGRFIVAIGHGVPAWMAQVGAAPRRRMAALEEVVVAIRALLAGETVGVAGTEVNLDEVGLANPPEVVPPVLVGTTGPRGLRMAGELADGFLLPEGCGPSFVEWATAEAGNSDRGAPPHRVVYAWTCIDDDVELARGRLEPMIRHWLDGGLYPEAYRRAGIEDPEDAVDMGRLVDELTVHGNAVSAVGTLHRLGAAGATDIVLYPVGHDSAGQVERLGSIVLPALKGATA